MGNTINSNPAVPPPPPATPSSIGDKLMASLEKIVDGLVLLRITTVIGEVSNGNIQESANGLQATFDAKPTDVSCTTINMLLGNCTTVRSQKFADNEVYAKLHQDDVAVGRTVRAETIDLVLKGIEAAGAMTKL